MRSSVARLVRDAGFDETAQRLEDAWQLETKVLALTINEREETLRVLLEALGVRGSRQRAA
jgi:hypothetical protein